MTSAEDWFLDLAASSDSLRTEQHALFEEALSSERPLLIEAKLNKNKRLLQEIDTKLEVAEYVSQIVEVLSEGKLTLTSPELSVEFEWGN